MKIITHHTLELAVEIHAESADAHITRITVGGVDITAAVIGQCSAYLAAQDAAHGAMQDALVDEREAA